MAHHPPSIPQKFNSFFQWVALFFLIGPACSESPKIPSLARRDAHPVEKVVFPGSIGPKEIRQIFSALNGDGRLNRLKPFLFEPSDASLARIGALFTDFFYRRNLESEGFPSVLNRHIEQRHFSELSHWFSSQSPLLSAQTGLAIGNPLFKDILQIDYRFLAPEWSELLIELLPKGFGFEKVSAEESVVWAKDLLALLRDPEIEQSFLAIASTFNQGQLASSLTSFVADMSEKEMKEVSARVSELSRDAKRPLNRIHSLFDLLKKHPPGLLVAAFDKLDKEPDIRGQFATQLFSESYDAVSASVERALATKELTTESDKFIAIRVAIQEITGLVSEASAPNALLVNLPIYLPSLALMLWLEEIAKSPANQTLNDRLFSKKTGPVDLNLKLIPPSLDIEIFTKKGDGLELNPIIDKKLAALELGDFAQSLKRIANDSGHGEFRYAITFDQEKMFFPEALRACIKQLEATRSFGDSAMLARVFFKRLLNTATRERLATLDSEDWLAWIHKRVLDPDLWPTVYPLLFSSRGLLSDGDTKRIVLSLFENPIHAGYLDKLFDELPLLVTLDASPRGQRSLLGQYLELNASFGTKEKNSLAKLSMEASHLLALSETKARGPLKGFSSLLSKPRSLNAILQFVNAAGRDHRDTFFAPFAPWKIYGVGATAQTHWQLIHATLGAMPPSDLALLIQAPLFDFSFSERKPIFSADDYLWWARLMEMGGWTGIHDYFSATSSPRTIFEFLTAVQDLEATGYLSEVFSLMQRIQDERVRAFAAALQNWQQSGELRHTLLFLKTLVN